jgi:hypothetical protein
VITVLLCHLPNPPVVQPTRTNLLSHAVSKPGERLSFFETCSRDWSFDIQTLRTQLRGQSGHAR